MIDDEPRLLISDSIKEEISVESLSEQESRISTLAFTGGDRIPDVLSILRGMESGAEKSIKFKISLRIDDGLSFFYCHEFDCFTYKVAYIEHLGLGKKIDLSDRKLTSLSIVQIDNDQQTCDCELVFHRNK